jgi:predicted N-acetyltransferase YhbS
MTPPPSAKIVVRPPANSDEMAAFFALAASTFMRDTPQSVAATDFRRYVLDGPAPDPASVRGAFRGNDYLGGYLIEERTLQAGEARLKCGCVGVVVTHPDHRRQGVATALMHDAFGHARARDMVLLLLHGMADFYTPFGYADVFDATEHAVRRADVTATPASPYRVRPATDADAQAMLRLYERHYGPHPGSFSRTVEWETFLLRFTASLDQQAYRQRDGSPFTPPVVAVDADDQPRGYLAAPWGPLRAFGTEVAADDWPALLALLQRQATSLDDCGAAPDQIRWPLPPGSLLATLMADHFVVESTRTSRPWANWEASLVDPLALMRVMLPIWNANWRRHRAPSRGVLALAIDDVTQVLDLSSDGGQLLEDATPADRRITLTGRVVLPLLFGFRSVAWAALQDGQRIPPDLLPILEILFPPLTPWIAPTDGC